MVCYQRRLLHNSCHRTFIYNFFNISNGPEWWRIRSEFQKGLSSPSNVRNFLPEADDITKEFVSKLKSTKAGEDIPDFLPILSRLNLESKLFIIEIKSIDCDLSNILVLCHIVFDVRMNSFSEIELNPTSRSSKLIEAAEMTNSLILPTDQGIMKLWRHFETPKFRKLRKAQEFMERYE